MFKVKHKNSNCFMHGEMVDFPKFGHIYHFAVATYHAVMPGR